MERFLVNLKEDLNEMGDASPMITVKRADLENLINAYEKLKLQQEKKTDN